MKLYTKILIGMAVGAVLGLLLGPKSALLEKDSYEVQAKEVTLLLDPDDPSSELVLPGGAKLSLRIIENRTKKVERAGKEPIEIVEFSKVRFKWTQRMGLADKSGAQAKALNVKVGGTATVWLAMQHKELSDGEILVLPVPVSGIGSSIISWIKPVGDLFMRLIKMVIVPLVFASLLVGVASLGDVRKLGRLGGRTILLYLCTTAAAVTIGLLAAHIVNPGSYVQEKDKAALVASFEGAADDKADNAAASPTFVDNVLKIVPTNPVASLATGEMLQVIFFAFLFGIALTMLEKKRSQEVVNFFDTVQHGMILIIHMVMKVAPYGVAALIADVVGQSGWSILSALLVYALTVIGALVLFAGMVYGSLVMFLARLDLISFLKAIRPAQLIAFSTSSSSATLPISMECAEENLGISRSVTSFVIPLGATVNMDGTALYQGVAAIFIAQVFGIDLSFGAQVGMVLAATAASIGAAGVPGAGMITLAMVLTTAGVPTVGVALILGVDRILDMFRTGINVTGDLAVTSVMARLEGEDLQPLSSDEDKLDKTRGFEGRTDREQIPVEPEGKAERDD